MATLVVTAMTANTRNDNNKQSAARTFFLLDGLVTAALNAAAPLFPFVVNDCSA